MCRLYGFRSNEPTKVECTLVHAQNALMVQSRADLAGYSHANGWGLATYENKVPHLNRQAWAAYHGEHFQRAAARVFSHQVLAHVRRATVGEPAIENTHPFVDGPWAFVHNGTIPNFERLRSRLLAEMPENRRANVHGATDSEHFFHFLRARQLQQPGCSTHIILRDAIETVIGWCREIDPNAGIGLNVIMTNGFEMVGSRLGRSLHYVERRGVHDCEICGFPHIHHDPHRDYRACIVASEPISHENWRDVPDGSIYLVNADYRMEVTPLAREVATMPKA